MAFKAALAGADWADDVEQEETKTGAPLANISDFPSLGEVQGKGGQAGKGKAKGKPQKMSLGDFMGGSSNAGFKDPALNEKAILMQLPTAPRGLREGEERSAVPAMGGAFRDYGGDRDGGRGGFGRREEGDRPPRRGEEDMGPSRADQAGDWGSMRKFTPGAGPGGDSGRGGFGGGFRDREASGGFNREPREPREFRSSAADEVDNWGATRKFEPSGPAPGGRREGGFRDGPGLGGPSRADEGDQWGRGREFKPSTGDSPSGPRPARGPSADANDRADKEDRWSRKPAAEESAPSSSQSAAVERPKLNLKPRTAPVDAAAPAGSSKSNPFGGARPVDTTAREKEIETKKTDDVKRAETKEEKDLKDEVEALQKQLEGLGADASEEESSKAKGQLEEKEAALKKLQAELDEAARSKKPEGKSDRPRAPPAGGPAGDKKDAPPPKSRW